MAFHNVKTMQGNGAASGSVAGFHMLEAFISVFI